LRVYNSFIATLALAFAGITVGLAAYQVDSMDGYFTAYTIALLVISALYATFSPQARRAVTLVGLVAFGGFMVLVALKVVEILSRR
jgi:hypothetical protein